MGEALQPDIYQQLQQRNEAYLQLQRKHIQYRSQMHGKFQQIGEFMLPHIAEYDRQIERVLDEYREILKYFDALKAQVARDIQQMHSFINYATFYGKQQFSKANEHRQLAEALKTRLAEAESELQSVSTAQCSYSLLGGALRDGCKAFSATLCDIHGRVNALKTSILGQEGGLAFDKLSQATASLVAYCVGARYLAQDYDTVRDSEGSKHALNAAYKCYQQDDSTQTVIYQNGTPTDKAVQCAFYNSYQKDVYSAYLSERQAEKLQRAEQENGALRQQLAAMAQKGNEQAQALNTLRMQLLDARTTVSRTASADYINAAKTLRQRVAQLEEENQALNSLLDSAKRDSLALQRRVAGLSYTRGQQSDIDAMQARFCYLEQNLAAERSRIESAETAALQLAAEFKAVCTSARESHYALRSELAAKYQSSKQYDLLYSKARRLERENAAMRLERQQDSLHCYVYTPIAHHSVQTDNYQSSAEGRWISNDELRGLYAAAKKSKQLCESLTDERDQLGRELAFAKQDRYLAAQTAKQQEEAKIQLGLLLDAANKEIVRLQGAIQNRTSSLQTTDTAAPKTVDEAIYASIPDKFSSDVYEEEKVQTTTVKTVTAARLPNSPASKNKKAALPDNGGQKAEIAEIGKIDEMGDLYSLQAAQQLFGRLGLEYLRQHAFIVDNLVTFMQTYDSSEAYGKANAQLQSTLRRMRFLCSANVILPEELRPQEATALISCLPASLRAYLCEAFCAIRRLEVQYDELQSKLPSCEEIRPILDQLKSDIPTLCLRSRSISFYLDQILLELQTNEIQRTASTGDESQVLSVVELNDQLLEARNCLHAKEAELALLQTEHQKLSLRFSRETADLSQSVQALEKRNQQLYLEFYKAGERFKSISGGGGAAEDYEDAVQSLQERVRIYQSTIAKLRSENLQLSQDCALQRQAVDIGKSGDAEQISRLESYNAGLLRENESLRYQVAALSICSYEASHEADVGNYAALYASGPQLEQLCDVAGPASVGNSGFDVEACRLKLSG